MRRLAIALAFLFLVSLVNPLIQTPQEEIEPQIVNDLTTEGPPGGDACDTDSDCDLAQGEICIGGECFNFLGSSFSSAYTCPDARHATGNLIVDSELCDRAKMVGEAHNGLVNYMLEAAGDRFPEPSFSAPTALESLYGLDSMIVRIGLDLPPAKQDKGCWVDGTDGNGVWVIPCPGFSRASSSTEGSSAEGREEKMKFVQLPYKPAPPLEPMPLEPVAPPIPPGIDSGGGGCFAGGQWGWVVPCPFGMMSIAAAYGDLRPDLLAQAEYLYENNNLAQMSDEERSQADAMNFVHYLESIDSSLRTQDQNTALNALGLLSEYFSIAAAAGDGSNGTLDELDESIDSVFSSSEYLEASPEVQEALVFMHAVHYASSELWIDYGELDGTAGRKWCWKCFWNVVKDVIGIAVGVGVGGDVGAGIVGASTGSIFGISGGGGEPIVECPLDRSLTINWWNCAHFVESVRSLEEGDFGYGTEWAPDAVAPMFDYSDNVPLGYQLTYRGGYACGNGICEPGEQMGTAHSCPADCGWGDQWDSMKGEQQHVWDPMYVYDTPYDETTAEEDLEFVNHIGFYGGTSGRAVYLTIGGVTVLLNGGWTCANVDTQMAPLNPGVDYKCEDYTGGAAPPGSASMGALVTFTAAGSVKGGCWVSGTAGPIWINPCPSGSPIDFDTGYAPSGCWVFGIDGPEWREPCHEFSWANLQDGDLQQEGCLVDEVQADGSTINVWSYPCPRTSDADADGVIDDWDNCDNTTAGVATDANGCEVAALADAVRDSTPGFTLFAVLSMLVGVAVISRRRYTGG